ncbi:MAG: primosomal protein N' [Cryobacterium sp.]|nr:primosomal protein N' [Cryobacterium sp.]
MTAAAVARVLLDSPLPQLDRLFEYRIPAALIDLARPGARVRVPLRTEGRIADGFIIELADDATFTGRLSELDSVVSPVAVLTREVYALARRLADRAAGGASDVVRLAVPKRYVAVEKKWLATDAAAPAPYSPSSVADYDTDAIDEVIARAGRVALDAVPRLVQVRGHEAPEHGSSEHWVGHWAITLATIATRALSRGSVILSVPDYRDQEQLLTALASVLPSARVVRLDARQSDRERYAEFLRCLDTTPRVIVGNRAALYAPATQLALIALWDDGDALHAEPRAPYVHGRDVALVRQERQKSALIFAGHARSTEVERLVEVGWLGDVRPERTAVPRVIATAYQASDDRLAQQARIPSTAWREARAGLEQGPVLVQVARPGYAPTLACEACGIAVRCRRCEGPVGFRTASGAATCAWCGAVHTERACEHCGSSRLRQRGQGSTRTAEELGRAFPGVPVVVSDGEHPVTHVGARPALVIATRGAEPIAAGGYRAVLLLDGERMLARESLRVAEDCLRWWSNAAALAAPQAPVVLVGVSGSIATALATWRLADYAKAELADRARLRFPPAVRVATITGEPAEVEKALAALPTDRGIDWLGPTAPDDDAQLNAGTVRSIVRFDYAQGKAVADILRAEVVRSATSRPRRPPKGQRRTTPHTLRVRLDDLEPFAEENQRL